MATLQESVSTDEFLRSGNLSNGIIVLQGEADNILASITAEDGNQQSPQRRIMENAVKVSLLLARSFVDSFHLDGGESCDGHQRASWSTIQLADFYVDFERHDVASGTPVIVLRGVSNFSPTEVDFPREQQEQPQDHPQEAVCEMSAFLDSVFLPSNPQTAPMRVLGNIFYTIFSQGRSPANLTAPSSDDPVVVDGEVEHSISNTVTTAAPSPLAAGVTSSLLTVDLDGEDITSMNSRSSRRLRKTEVSVFTRLVDCNLFPMSICRLLSDMINAGPGEKADSPFTSFGDVIQELEWMISRPGKYLHDSYYPHGVPKRPVFGHAFCGRKEEISPLLEITVQMEESLARATGGDDGGGSDSKASGVEVVFVSGIPGSGKSHLVKATGETLSRIGWIFAKCKFERKKTYASLGVLSSMFDNLLSHLVKLKEGGDAADVDYCGRVSKSILALIGRGILSELVGFLPSIPLLFPDIVGSKDRDIIASGALVYPLSKILEAFLEPGQFIMLCCDDLQWADRSTIDLMSEVLINVGGLQRISRHCLFVGLYRSNEVDDDHPLEMQKSLLFLSSSVNVTEMEVAGLSKNDICEMAETELKLPRRMVTDLADAVHKKTSGHTIFVVEFLNSLLNESIIAYSSQKRCYTWDPDRIDFIQTGDNVAEFIASNTSSLPPKTLSVLQILSCFSMQVDDSLLQVLEQFQEGILSSIDTLVERGILDRAGPIIIFAHDLILQSAYESLPLADMQALHLKIGQFLGLIVASNNGQSSTGLLVSGMDQLQLSSEQSSFFAGSQLTSTLTSLACDQVNLAGDLLKKDDNKRMQFSQWNLSVGEKMMDELNYSAALLYYEKGISFLGEDCWKVDPLLSSKLHTGATRVSNILFHISEDGKLSAIRYADILTEHLTIEARLETEAIAMRALMYANPKEGISRGFKTAQRLNMNIPASPTEADVVNAIATTYGMVAQYSTDDIDNLCCKDSDESHHHNNVVEFLHAFSLLFWVTSSHSLYHLLTCEVVRYSLQHRICRESTDAFAGLGMLLIASEGDFLGGKRLADATRTIMAHYLSPRVHENELMAMYTMYFMIDVWFEPLRDIVPKAQNFTERCEDAGLFYNAVIWLGCSLTMRVHGGENLSIISQTAVKNIQLIAKGDTQGAVLDQLLLASLTGETEAYSSALGGSCSSLDGIQAAAEAYVQIVIQYIGDNTAVPILLPVFHMLCSYWKGDFISAEKHLQQTKSKDLLYLLPLHFQLHVFFGGLVCFQLYRTVGGDDRLEIGKAMRDKMEKWAQNSMLVFETKWLLLKAEHAASVNGKSDLAEDLYNASIKTARDRGNIHEVALAYELYGNYFHGHGCSSNSIECFEKAYLYYTQWGASAVAERVLREHNLDITSVANSGHKREFESILDDGI